jgi:hypothetical protein
MLHGVTDSGANQEAGNFYRHVIGALSVSGASSDISTSSTAVPT